VKATDSDFASSSRKRLAPAALPGDKPATRETRGSRMDSEKQKMLAGELYRPGDHELAVERHRAAEWMARYNATGNHQHKAQQALLREAFGHVGIGAVVRAPFHCDYGYNISLGSGVFLNFNCVILDTAPVVIGDDCQIGPGVQILAADHPRDAQARAEGLEFARPVTLGANVWIGGGAIILPGVSIGDHAIIGAGSVVTRDVPAHAVAVGNPARPRS
jgi:maltose O-acetyltransferase